MYGLDISSGMEDPSKFIHAFYGGFHRAAWALALGWLIFACTRGYGGEWMLLQGTVTSIYRLHILRYYIAGSPIRRHFLRNKCTDNNKSLWAY